MGAGVVMLREGFEASLIVGIVLAVLNRTGRRDAFVPVWIGAAFALLVSVAVAAVLFAVDTELQGTAEAIWEGGTMLLASVFLVWMMLWMRSQARSMGRQLELQVEQALAAGSALGLGLVAFVGVLREGVEIAVFLFSSLQGANAVTSVVGAVTGSTIAVSLGYAFYRGSSRFDLRRFFSVTSALMLAFAAWLFAGGLHELGEGGAIPERWTVLIPAIAVLALASGYLRSRIPRLRASRTVR